MLFRHFCVHFLSCLGQVRAGQGDDNDVVGLISVNNDMGVMKSVDTREEDQGSVGSRDNNGMYECSSMLMVAW